MDRLTETKRNQGAAEARRNLGRYDTPRPLSQAISDWALRSADDKALEPSSGSGVFVLSLAHSLRQLGQRQPNSQIWACDIDSAACSQTKLVSGLIDEHVWNDDFLALVSDEGFTGRRFDCVVGNPPYISLHRMSHEQRKRVCEAADRLKLNLSRRASLWAYFLAASAHVLRLDGRVAFILPESLLHAEYALGMVRNFAASFATCTLVSIRERCFVSDGAAERVVVLLADKFRATPGVTEIALHECVTADDAVNFLTRLRTDKALNLPKLNGHAVPHLLPPSGEPAIELSTVPCSRVFGDFADVKIGVVTGADDFFLLSEPDRKKLKLRQAWLTPLLPRFQECRGLSYKRLDWEAMLERGEKCWLLSPPEGTTSRALESYLATFPAEQKRINRTFTKRKLWFAPVLGRKPHAFLRYMGTTGPRLAFTRFDANCTNVIHRVFFHSHVSSLQRKAILLSLHSSYSQLQAEFEGRAYGSGVLKLEPSEVRRLRLLLPNNLDKACIDRCFDAVDIHLRNGTATGATALIDDWLYQSILDLEAALPRQRLADLLKMSVQRRMGYPRLRSSGDRKIDSTNSESGMPLGSSNPSKIENASLKADLPPLAPKPAKLDLKLSC